MKTYWRKLSKFINVAEVRFKNWAAKEIIRVPSFCDFSIESNWIQVFKIQLPSARPSDSFCLMNTQKNFLTQINVIFFVNFIFDVALTTRVVDSKFIHILTLLNFLENSAFRWSIMFSIQIYRCIRWMHQFQNWNVCSAPASFCTFLCQQLQFKSLHIASSLALLVLKMKLYVNFIKKSWASMALNSDVNVMLSVYECFLYLTHEPSIGNNLGNEQ